MIESLRNKDCTVASLLSTLIRSSKDLTDESTCSESHSASAVKLNKENLLENENYVSDYSPLHAQVLNLGRKVERMMDETIKVLIVDIYHCAQIENMERQQNVILESIGNHNRERQIGEATFQALESENKIKADTLENIIDTKVSGSVRKYYSEAPLQMIKLAKKVIDLEKLPKKGTRVMEGQHEKRVRKKAKRKAVRKEKRVMFQQQNQTAIRQESNNGNGSRSGPRQGRGNQSRCPITRGRENGGGRGNGGGNMNTPTRSDSVWPQL